ncbi:hypothetical protein [Roseofilum sp. Belize Diploria]|uniref:hypothetical protein n=1 Tax=Roseofilum sp. Belize Diploria TaxID=2821501 RepID=UPI000E7E5157|nr:hypothetical protein [Roseofilum sp. Belize Diploria]MBP0009246.1 hypothetical protein [Roseofilum sp. Belize Diploria]HBR00290.1 hypothetical protein [Cyanobacteria bacterium UBA11691]
MVYGISVLANIENINSMENLKKGIKNSGMSKTWYMVIATYLLLFTLLGYTTFFHNNDFTTNHERFEKMVRNYGDEEKQKLVNKLLKDDADSSENSNSISSQSFNLILGAIVSFLSSTLMSKR